METRYEHIYILDNIEIDYLFETSIFTVFISFVVNIFGLNMLINHSKRDNTSYRYCLIVSQITAFIPQCYWGICQCTIALFPFPGFISQGILASYVSTMILFFTWFGLFTIHALSFIYVLIIRLKIVEAFITKKSSNYTLYITLVSILLGFCWIFIIYFIFNNVASVEYISSHFPNYIHLLQVKGIFIVTDEILLRYSICIVVFTIFSTICFYIYLCYKIIGNVKSQQNKMSRSQKNHQKKVLYESIIQSCIKCVTCGSCGTWWVLLFIFAPIGNVNMFTLIVHCIFVGAPIPGTIVMLYQHPTYFKKDLKKVSVPIIQQSSIQNYLRT
ncbi:unnamed protein product [Caenorhabditis angaria]|uniref:Uncharacterized protein n=1 Tax=Caenorhabditis angaria TaxID=860376 RepID=A0A9P1IY35_9PELO|nr:unnamed protein product [Caenorhabditis angaria]